MILALNMSARKFSPCVELNIDQYHHHFNPRDVWVSPLQGDPGIPGERGVQGDRGRSGDPGPIGLMGEAGQKGDPGPPGRLENANLLVSCTFGDASLKIPPNPAR